MTQRGESRVLLRFQSTPPECVLNVLRQTAKYRPTAGPYAAWYVHDVSRLRRKLHGMGLDKLADKLKSANCMPLKVDKAKRGIHSGIQVNKIRR